MANGGGGNRDGDHMNSMLGLYGVKVEGAREKLRRLATGDDARGGRAWAQHKAGHMRSVGHVREAKPGCCSKLGVRRYAGAGTLVCDYGVEQG